MSSASKCILLLFKNQKSRHILIGIIITVCVLALIIIAIIASLFSNQKAAASQAANIAKREYDYFQSHTPEVSGLSCIGEKYCSYYNVPVVDWCCYFAGYCYKEGGLDDDKSGFASVTNVWTSNLEEIGKLKSASSGYKPQVGNAVFFNYSGRANYAVTGFVAHVGIVTEVSGDTITIIAGNEYNGQTSDWASVSYINKYSISVNNDSIACYGDIGVSTIQSTGLNSVVRNLICHNEVGVLYDEINTDYYGSVIANDVGAISIGVYGWHGNKALSILQKAYEVNSGMINNIASSYGTSGAYVLDAIVSGADWSSYIPDENVCSCIKSMLLTEAGKEAQDEISLEDAQSYIDICKNNGLSDRKSIAYCCDILNQYGTASFNSNVYGAGSNGVLFGVSESMSLDDIYNSQRAWSDSNYDYTSRRTWTFKYLSNLSDDVFNESTTTKSNN